MKIIDSNKKNCELLNLRFNARSCWMNHEMSSLGIALIISIVLILGIYSSSAFSKTQTQYRDLFKQATSALNKGNLSQYRRIAKKTKSYELYPYLEYYELKTRIEYANKREIDQFLKKYTNTPLSALLRTQWLFYLAKKNYWKNYIKYYKKQASTRLQCHYIYALFKTSRTKKETSAVLKKAKKLWLVGHHQPKECIPIFTKLEASKLMTSSLLWKRIGLAMEKGNVKLVSYLSKDFNTRDKRYIALWKKVFKNPEKGLNTRLMRQNRVVTRQIAYQAIKRIARRNVSNAYKHWQKAKRRYGFTKDEKREMQRYIALRAAYQHHPSALKWLNKVNTKLKNKKVRTWKARTALRMSNWKALISSIKGMKNRQRNENKWQYWLARSYEQLGKTKKAKASYRKLARLTNYYGFLAADRVGVSYTFNSQALEPKKAVLAELSKVPGFVRSKELFRVGRLTDARREWNYVIRKFNESKIKAAAVLAHEWEWYDNAILTVAKTSHRRDLNLRFPTPFRDQVMGNAETNGIDASLIYGVARRESAFKVDAQSSAGAMGLMQLLPSTARLQSKKLGLTRPSRRDLLKSEHNILLGSAYLSQMLERFNGNQVYATAAYNAGPNRVAKWLDIISNDIPADVWVDIIPYNETREYIKAVMAYSAIFDWKLENSVKTLKARMSMDTSLKQDDEDEDMI